MISNWKQGLWLAVTAALATGAVLANDVQLASINIPASACQPARTDNTPLELSNGAYVFRGELTGTASLICPLPVRPTGTTGIQMRGFRIYFRDPSSNNTSASVSARLRYRNSTGWQNASNDWISNCPGSTCTDPPGTEDTIRSVPVTHTLTGGRLYHFLVQLHRDSTQHGVAFTGIDFPVSSPPLW